MGKSLASTVFACSFWWQACLCLILLPQWEFDPVLLRHLRQAVACKLK